MTVCYQYVVITGCPINNIGRLEATKYIGFADGRNGEFKEHTFGMAYFYPVCAWKIKEK